MAIEHTIAVQRAHRALSGLYPIPDITLDINETHDMSQYIGSALTIISSQVIGLNTNIATYSHATKLLTGVAGGTMTGLQYEITA